MKLLIVTGDDFGRSAGVNEAIAAYHAAGALTQASLMVAESHATEAAAIARAHPRLCVGLHLTLSAGRATQPSALTDRHGSFTRSPAAAGLRYALDPRLREPLRLEIRRQFEAFRALGLPPTYWDGHTHLHLHPTVFEFTLPIAREFGFRFTRLVREPCRPAILPWIFNQLSAHAQRALGGTGIGFADRVYGLRRTGRIDKPWLDKTLRALPLGVSEIYFHPGAEGSLPPPETLAALVRRSAASLASAATLTAFRIPPPRLRASAVLHPSPTPPKNAD